MRSTAFGVAAGVTVAMAALAASARADESLEGRLSAVERQLAASATPSARDIQASVDAYLSTRDGDAALVGGPGSAGYDGGFWIRGGSFLLRTNLTLQTRYEVFLWNQRKDEPRPGGDLSGFSLPRVTLKLSGDATCNVHYYAELEFGHAAQVASAMAEPMGGMGMGMPGMVEFASDPGICREAWIEYEASPELSIRMGLVKTAATRQLMTPPEMQQFVDISLAAASVGQMMSGYTDRNRDYGIAIHGALGCDGALTYLFTITNGDGPVHHNVVDGMTNDNLAYSGRLNWDFLGHMGYEECALRQCEGKWVGSVGVWGWAYTMTEDNPHMNMGTMWDVGVDTALGYGGFSFCAAYTYSETSGGDPGFQDQTSNCACVQLGYLFPQTAWEVAGRWSYLDMEMGSGATKMDEGAFEYAFAVNYFIDGHADKLTADVSFISGRKDGNELDDAYTGYQATGKDDAILLRFQWQLAL